MTTPRLKALDALRGIAVSVVLLFHFLHQYPKHFDLAPLPFDNLLVLGGYGVDLFFIISGFVIFMSLERSRSFAGFLKARAMRLFPAYWVALMVTFLCTTLGSLPSLKVGFLDFAANFTMLQQLLGRAHVDGAYWSLQAEWGFYGSIALLYFSGALRRLWLGLAIWLGVAVSVHMLSTLLGAGLIGKMARFSDLLFAFQYIHLFIMGMVFYEAWRHGRFTAIHGIIIVATLARQSFNEGWAVGALTSVYALVMVQVVRNRLAGLAANRTLLFLGRISYSLYLIHQNIGYLVIDLLRRVGLPFSVAVTGAVALTLGLAVLLNHFVEGPALRLLRRSALGDESERRPSASATLAGETSPSSGREQRTKRSLLTTSGHGFR